MTLTIELFLFGLFCFAGGSATVLLFCWWYVNEISWWYVNKRGLNKK